jgi:PAS domain S-box-containing protein
MENAEIWFSFYWLHVLPILAAVLFYWRGRKLGKQLGALRIHNVVKRAAGAGRATVPGPVVDALPVMLSCQDLEGRYLFLNARQATIFGVPPESAIGLTQAELLGKRHDKKATEVERAAIKSGEPAAPFEQIFTDANGRDHRWLTFKVPVKNDSGRVMYLATLCQDMDGGNLLPASAGAGTGSGDGGAEAAAALRAAEEQARALIERAHRDEERVARKLADAEARQREADAALARAREAETRARTVNSNADASASRADSEQAERLGDAERQLTQARLDLERTEARLKQNEQESLRAVNEAERRARDLLDQAERRQAEADRALEAARAREAEALSRAKDLEQQAQAAMARANQLVAQASETSRGSETEGEHRAAKMLAQAREEADRYVNEARQKAEELLADARRQGEELARRAGDSQQSQREFERARERIRDLERQATEAMERANAKTADSDALMRRATSFEADARRHADALQTQAEQLLAQARQREKQLDEASRDLRRREEQAAAALREAREREARIQPSRGELEAERIIARAREREAQAEQAVAYARQKADELLTMAREREALAAGTLSDPGYAGTPQEPAYPAYAAAMPAPDESGWSDGPRTVYGGMPVEKRRSNWSANLALIAALAMAAILAAALWYRDDLLGKKRTVPGDRRPARVSVVDPPVTEKTSPRHVLLPADSTDKSPGQRD